MDQRNHRNGGMGTGGGGGTVDARDDIFLETNFDEDGILTFAHAPTNHQQPVANRSRQINTENPLLQRQQPFNARRSFYRSDMSIDRYSEYSLHGRRDPG